MRHAFASAVTVLLLVSMVTGVGHATARAQAACASEVEPNDTPDGASTASGALCLTGTLPDDDQDLLIWDVAGVDAARRWTVGLTGVPDTTTSLTLLPITSDPGVEPVVTGTPVLELDSSPTSSGPVTEADLLIAAGSYVLGVSRSPTTNGEPAATVDYQVSITDGAALPPSGDIEPNDDAKHASRLRGAFDVAGDLGGSIDRYAWTVSTVDAQRTWSLEEDGPVGYFTTLSLIGPDGATLTAVTSDGFGRAELTDLRLAAATYQVDLGPAAEAALPYVLAATASSAVVGDPEPNDTAATAVSLGPGDLVARGRIAHAGDVDTYALTVTDPMAASLLDIRVVWHADLQRTVCLSDVDGTQLACRDGKRDAVLDHLLLLPGRYTITVGGDPSATDTYLVRVDATSPPAADFETEPNDTAAEASAWDPTLVMRGGVSEGDRDYYRIAITGPPQLWRLDATGADIATVAWVTADDTALGYALVASDGTSASLEDMYLIPGDHWLVIAGTGDYDLQLTPLGPPDPDGEREPNNDADHAQAIRIGQHLVGRLAQTTDTDVYRFSLEATEHLLLHIDPPADGGVGFQILSGGTVIASESGPATGAPVVYDAMLPAGDYALWLTTATASDKPYTVELDRGDPFTTAVDQEPNDQMWMADPMPASETVSGSGTPSTDDDWFRLLPLDSTGSLVIRTQGAIDGLGLSDGANDLAIAVDEDGETWHADGLPLGVPLYLRVTSQVPYTVSIVSGEPVSAVPGPLAATLELTTDEVSVAAYWQSGQRVDGQLVVRNTGTVDEDLHLDTLTSHVAWSAELGQEAVTVPAGSSVTVPVTIHAQPDAWADEPVRISVRARDASGAQQTASVDIAVDRDQPPVDTEQGWSVPSALRGGLDIAAPGLGGAPAPAFDPAAEAQLYDGVAPSGAGFSGPFTGEPVTLTVDLAGTDPIPVAGIILDPQAGGGDLEQVPRTFDLLLSTDGIDFQQVMSGTLSPLPVDQPFVLPAPVLATVAQLRIDSVYADRPDTVALGEWKVIATPGVTPSTEPLDIADPGLGGHVVWMDPQTTDPAFADQLLSADPARETLPVARGAKPQWVVGFQDDRAAAIGELRWIDPPGSDAKARFRSVDVAVSLDSPLGPWRDIGTWQLDRSGGAVTPFRVPDATWARFLRFTGRGPGPRVRDWEEPATIQVLERATDAGYRSVFGEWGQVDRTGIYEQLLPPDPTPETDTPGADNTAATADPLIPSQVATGRVQHGQHVHWYAVSVPSDHDTITFTLGGTPFVGAGLVLLDSAGTEIPMTVRDGVQPGTVTYTADVTGGASYDVRVEQPPFSAVFTYDTSISLAPFEPFVKEAVAAFGASVVPGREAVKIIPFESRPLLLDWSDQPYALEGAAENAVDESLSSSAETALLNATGELTSRKGARAVLMVTDGETASYDRSSQMWSALAATRPLVFTVHVGGSDEPIQSRHFMQDWAASAGGMYQYARTHDEVDRAFDRMATWLRRPAAYSLSVATAFVRPPPRSHKPAGLRVVSADGGGATSVPVGADTAIEIILDTSGSMLDKLEGRRRIDIAQSVLTHLVQDKLPVGVPVALRVFGDTPRSCDTRLAVPLGPLDPKIVTARIRGLHILSSVNTPIGAALAQVADDLAGVTGPRIVVLVTDGKENCGGDAAAAVRRLVRAGDDVHVNIVGFALDQRSIRKALAAWARAGHGSYFDSTGSSDLNHALAQAVSAPYRVLDGTGAVVVTGTVNGAAVRLKPGSYTVQVLTDPEVTLQATVEAGTTLELDMPAPSASPDP